MMRMMTIELELDVEGLPKGRYVIYIYVCACIYVYVYVYAISMSGCYGLIKELKYVVIRFN